MLRNKHNDNNRDDKKNILFVFIVLLSVFITSCSKENDIKNAFPFGIWQGTFLEKPISIEFRKSGCAILMSQNGDDIGFSRYSIDLDKNPGYLDLEFITPPGHIFKSIIEKMDSDTLRIQLNEGKPIRPQTFTSEAFIMHRAHEHVMPRGISMEEYKEECKQLLLKESIWFEGKDHDKLLNICEALYRHQFMNNASGEQQNAPAYFLSIYETDPPHDLMLRFEKNMPPVKPGSEFKIELGLKFRIRGIKILDKYNVEIEGGYYSGPLSSSGNTYKLKKKNGKWQVISDKMNWIS
jgi:hypothetical protein